MPKLMPTLKMPLRSLKNELHSLCVLFYAIIQRLGTDPVSLEHLFKDVLTCYLLSDSPNDKTPFIDRVAGPEVGNQVRNFIEKWQEEFEKNISGMRKVLNDFYKLKIR